MDFVIKKAENLSSADVPVIAAISIGDDLISMENNKVEIANCSFYHAEFLAVQEALRILNTRYLSNASLYVTLEPCSFCATVLEKVRIKEIFFGAYDPKCGAVFHNSKIFDHSLFRPNIIGGIQESRCSKIVERFFKEIRKSKNERNKVK
jgi:tRNA(Arg) A34 adenosine deaminase TadA